MRTFFAAAALLWPSLTSAFALPSLPLSESPEGSRHISSVFGSASKQEVSIRLETPCQGCSIGTDDSLVFDLTIPRAKTECGNVLPLVNGVPLVRSWRQNHGRGHGLLQTKLVNGLDEREIYASWQTLCIPNEAQLLSFTVHSIGSDKVKQASGFTVSFKQQGQPEILRLSGEPADLEQQDISRLDTWATPPLSLRLSVLAPKPDRDIEQILERHFRQLDELKAEARQLNAAIHHKKIHIGHLIQQDFRSTINSCHGIKCVLQTTFQKVPKIIQFIVNHFHHGRPTNSQIYKQSESWAVSINETRSLEEDHDGSPPPDSYLPPSPSPPSSPGGLAPPAPPTLPIPPTPPSPPTPPTPPTLPTDHDWHHGHYPVTPAFFPPHHHRHRHFPKVLKHVIFAIVLSTLASLLFRHLRRNTNLFRCCPRAADRACRREERRNRRAHRRAALRHQWSTWWNRYRRPTSATDYEEKRNLVLEQEGVLEGAMQDEIRVLRSAHQIVEEMYDAEEGRSRLYRTANLPGAVLAPPVELDAAVGSASGRRAPSPLSLYSLPPPEYDEELEGDLTVVDGFQYTPSNSVDDDTPDSSVVDCSPRTSCDTGRTMVTRGGDRD